MGMAVVNRSRFCIMNDPNCIFKKNTANKDVPMSIMFCELCLGFCTRALGEAIHTELRIALKAQSQNAESHRQQAMKIRREPWRTNRSSVSLLLFWSI